MRETKFFIAIGSKEDEEQIVDLNKKDLGPEKAIEAEIVQEVVKEKETIEEPKKTENVIEQEDKAENVSSPSQSVKRRGGRKNTFARKKRMVDVQSHSEFEEEKKVKLKRRFQKLNKKG
jgi:hypothetical protein